MHIEQKVIRFFRFIKEATHMDLYDIPSSTISIIIILIFVFIPLYFLPSFLGRKKRNFTAIFILNLFAGGTGIGWLIALIWSLRKDRVQVSSSLNNEISDRIYTNVDLNDRENDSIVSDLPMQNLSKKSFSFRRVVVLLVIVLSILCLIAFVIKILKSENVKKVDSQSKNEIPVINRSVIPVPRANSTTYEKEKTLDLLSSNTVMSCSDQFQLIKLYGDQNIRKEKAYDREDNPIGWRYVLFPGTKNEAYVSFQNELPLLEVENQNSKWKFPYGIYIGMPIDDLVKINGRDFQFYGFEWDYGGLIADWNGGKLEDSGIFIELYTTTEETEIYLKFITGDKTHSSSQEGIDELKPYVGTIKRRKTVN